MCVFIFEFNLINVYFQTYLCIITNLWKGSWRWLAKFKVNAFNWRNSVEVQVMVEKNHTSTKWHSCENGGTLKTCYILCIDVKWLMLNSILPTLSNYFSLFLVYKIIVSLFTFLFWNKCRFLIYRDQMSYVQV